MMMGIYSLTSPSGKSYIGSTLNCKRRQNQHFRDLKKGTHHNQKLQAAWEKYRKLDFRVIIVCRKEDLFFYEQLCLDKLKPAYNINPSAVGARGLKWSEESKAKLKGRQTYPELISAGMLNFTTPEQRSEQARLARAGWTDKSQTSQIIKLTGRKLSEEHRSNIGAAHLGQKRSSEAKEAMSAAQIERFQDPTERAKISQSRIGIVFSPEHIANLKKAQKLRTKEPRLGIKGSGGKPIICVEIDTIFASMGLALEWVKSIGKSKAQNPYKGYGGISLAANGKRAKAFGYTWRFQGVGA